MSDKLEEQNNNEIETSGAVFFDADDFLPRQAADEPLDQDQGPDLKRLEKDPEIAKRRVSNFMREHFERLRDDEITFDISDDEGDGTSYMQNRELSWLSFNERVLDQGADDSVPLLERLNFVSIFSKNLTEFFRVRVGSLTDLTSIDPPVRDSKTNMTAKQQLKAIYKRCRQLYPIQESVYEHVRGLLAQQGIKHLHASDLTAEQTSYLKDIVENNIEPFLSPQIINSRHPFPHLENEKLYILVRLSNEDEAEKKSKKQREKEKGSKKDKGAKDVLLGLIPLPHQCERIVRLPGPGLSFILLEHVIEMFASDIFSMYKIKRTNVVRVTRSADIDADDGIDELDDYREHMRRLLKRRDRLQPVRLECERPLSSVTEALMLKKLKLKRYQIFASQVPLSMSFVDDVVEMIDENKRIALSYTPFTPAWPVCLDRNRRIMDQVAERDVLLFYPYESMDPFVMLLREAAQDPSVISIKITLYRLAQQSHVAEALIAAAEQGKEVCALFELRARFDENNNIEWSQRFERAGCSVVYGFKDLKVHSKICCITRRLPNGKIQHITQLGTGNYNEKTAKIYTDMCYITANEEFARDGMEFFRNMQLENISDNYNIMHVAPLQIKQTILREFDKQIKLARAGLPNGAFIKANSLTDKDILEKIAEASRAGVGVTLFIRGICCLVPGVPEETEEVRVVSLIGRLLEHSRIYCFGQGEDSSVYLSSADLMTRNLEKRIEIAWPLLDPELKRRVLIYINVCMHDTAKLRELRPNGTYTPLGAFTSLDQDDNPNPPYDSQVALIEEAALAAKHAAREAFQETVSEFEPEDLTEVEAPYSLYDEPASPDDFSRPYTDETTSESHGNAATNGDGETSTIAHDLSARNSHIELDDNALNTLGADEEDEDLTEMDAYLPLDEFEEDLAEDKPVELNDPYGAEEVFDDSELEESEPTPLPSSVNLNSIPAVTDAGYQPYQPQAAVSPYQATGSLPAYQPQAAYQTGQLQPPQQPLPIAPYQTGSLAPYQTGPVIPDAAAMSAYQTGPLPAYQSPVASAVHPSPLQNLPNIQLTQDQTGQIYLGGIPVENNAASGMTTNLPHEEEMVVPFIPTGQLPIIDPTQYPSSPQGQLTDMTIDEIIANQDPRFMNAPFMNMAQTGAPNMPSARQMEESSFFAPRKQEIVMPPEKRGLFRKKK